MSHLALKTYLEFEFGLRAARREFIELLLRQGSATADDVAAAGSTQGSFTPDEVARHFERLGLVERTATATGESVWNLPDAVAGAAWLSDHPNFTPLTTGAKLVSAYARRVLTTRTKRQFKNEGDIGHGTFN